MEGFFVAKIFVQSCFCTRIPSIGGDGLCAGTARFIVHFDSNTAVEHQSSHCRVGGGYRVGHTAPVVGCGTEICREGLVVV